jgi:hypothetical protein
MRILILPLLLAASPAFAWEATIGPICTLTHNTPTASVELTYDPAAPLYTITITLTRKDAAWPDARVFEMTFDGPNPLSITTNRHALSDNNKALTVSDQGFGNVLDGLQFNDTATALSGGAQVSLPLDGTAPAVQAFRDCPPSVGA